MNHLKRHQVMKAIIPFFVIFVVNIAFASEDKELTLTSENYFAINQTCQSYKIIEGKKYCVKESLIPLNSCGVQSDWPCMDPEGCLGITQFIKE
ncbi:hypothetical protein OAS17_02755 [Methylophilaceae bacterium]|nr:hypothetical protein [Methylophilaceae bacterium]